MTGGLGQDSLWCLLMLFATIIAPHPSHLFLGLVPVYRPPVLLGPTASLLSLHAPICSFRPLTANFCLQNGQTPGGIPVHAFLWFVLWPSSLNVRPHFSHAWVFFIALWVFCSCWFLPSTVLPTKLQPCYRQCSGFSIAGAEFCDGLGSPLFHSLICFSHPIISAPLTGSSVPFLPCGIY